MKLNNKKAITILNYAVEYYDMMYNSGDKRHDEEEAGGPTPSPISP